MNDNGPTIGYTPNAIKSVLIIKPELYANVVELFCGSGVIVTKDGQRHLGVVIGTEEFKEKYDGEKVPEWVKEVVVLSDMARTEPHAAYSTFTHAWLTTTMDICHAHHPRHQPSSQIAGKLHHEHLATSAAEISYPGG